MKRSKALRPAFAIAAATAATAIIAMAHLATAPAEAAGLVLRPIGTYSTGFFAEGGAEITAYDAAGKRLFVVNALAAKVDVIDISRPGAPRKVGEIDGSAFGGGINSVAIHGDLVAVAIEAEDKQQAGAVGFYSTAGAFLKSVAVGALPDMLAFTPDGSKVLVANEGEPKDYCAAGLANDPEGSVSVIDLSGGIGALTQANVRTADFKAWNGAAPVGVRIFGPNATVSQDLEPEYIAVAADGRTAWVTLQENNAIGVLDIAQAKFTALVPLGTKDHSLPGQGLDASDRDGGVRIVPHPVRGMYQPDAIAAFSVGSTTYLATANEGDARDYDCYSEEERIGDVALDPAIFPNAEALQGNGELGRLRTTSASGDADDDGDFDLIHSFGARSFSIWSGDGRLVWDSGDDFELITAVALPDGFNSTHDDNDSFDGRSDDKGPEPEGLALGVVRGRRYAFVGLERVGGVMVYDVTEPTRASFVQYVNPRSFGGDPEAGTAGPLGPEGMLFIPRDQSPISRSLLITANEVSGTVTIYSILPRP